MFKWLQHLSPQLLSLMRIAVGITFVEHGTQKLLSFPVPAPGALGIFLLLFTGILETVGGTLVAIGLLTRPAAFLLSGELAVGYWWMHAPRSLFPMANGGGAKVLFFFVFLFFSARRGGGPGFGAPPKRGAD